MNHHLPKRLLLAVAQLALSTMLLVAAPGDDLTGFYQVTNVVEGAQSVHLTLTLKLVSNNGFDEAGARVSVADWVHAEEFTFFNDVAIPANGSIFLEGTVVVSPDEHELWLNGLHPQVSISWEDSETNLNSLLIPLLEMPLK